MIEFYKRKDWEYDVDIIHQSSDESHLEERFDNEGFDAEKEYFLGYLLNEKRKIENLVKEEVYLVFNLCMEDYAVCPEEITARIPFSLETLKEHFIFSAWIQDNKILTEYIACLQFYSLNKCYGYPGEEQICYVKKSDLIDYLYNNEDTSDFFTNKLVEFKFNENEFYKLEDSCLSKKKEFDMSKETLQYQVDTSILGDDFIGALGAIYENELSISNMSGLIRNDLKKEYSSDDDIDFDIPF